MTPDPCPYCTNGTFTDCNGATWKCHYCLGLRAYSDRDFDRLSDQRAENGESTPYPHPFEEAAW